MFEFDREEFPEDVANLTQSRRSDKQKIKKKLLYFARYLKDICASVCIVEEGYPDQNLQSDLWASASYGDSTDDSTAKSPCIRLHFFKAEKKDSKKINKVLRSLVDVKTPVHSEKEELEDHALKTLAPFFLEFKDKYLGFMVIHLEGTKIVGTTCLSTYQIGKGVPVAGNTKPKQIENREIPAVREYAVNVVGHKMSVNSIGFQEQDGVTSACATCSLWSLFQMTSKKYQHHSPSPREITGLALGIDKHAPLTPGKLGLTPSDVEEAISSIPEIRPFSFYANLPCPNKHQRDDLDLILNFALPILGHGIPVILQIEKMGGTNPPVHAICLVGYNYTDGQGNVDRMITRVHLRSRV